jgi:hypothetical protein
MTRETLGEWIDKAIEADPQTLDVNDLDDDLDLPAGPPLTSSEIEAARISLAQWEAPEAFKKAVDALSARCASGDWFNSPQLKFLHDAFVLARFAQRRKVDQVRLAEATAQWPDGYVRIGSRTHNIEITSTHGGRKLGDEYREVRGPTMDPVEKWVERGDSIPKFLDEVVGAKSRKHYSAPCWLVVYLNISEYGIRQKETAAAIEGVRQRYGHAFEAITVMWKGRLY